MKAASFSSHSPTRRSKSNGAYLQSHENPCAIILLYKDSYARNVAVLTHGLVKEKAVPNVDIERALNRKRKFERDPEKHTFQGDDDNG